ncbi:MAG: FISUMP domain-containing protein, partial [Bacteroidota bacterium]
ENKGQVIDQNNNLNPAVLYLLNTPGMNVQLRRGGFSYDLYRISNIEQRMLNDEVSQVKKQQALSSIQYHRIDFDLQNFNPDYTIETSEPSPGYENYYTPGTPEKGVTAVRHFKNVTFKNIYPEIDLEFLTDGKNGFKYNFVVHQGGNLSAIQMKISGAGVELTSSGSLLLSTSLGTIEEDIPKSFLRDEKITEPVTIKFLKISDGVFGFRQEGRSGVDSDLIIDPVPIRMWGTYFGGSDGDALRHMTADSDSNAILVGTTFSPDYIATNGAWQTTLIWPTNGFIAKFNTNGQLLWATYYGGSWTETFSVVTDNALNIFIFGETSGNPYIVTSGSYQTTYGGGYSDTYLAKFTPAGQRVWGTYYGGPGQDNARACTIDREANIYVTGQTLSSTGIATSGAYQTTKQGVADAYIGKFDSTGQQLLWGSYFGGELDEMGMGLATAGNDDVYLTGSTKSTTNISTAGTSQPVYGGGMGDGFIAAFSPSGQRLWATYYGGLSTDVLYWIAVFHNNSLFVTGTSASSDNISTPGSYQPALHGESDAVLGRFDLTGNRIWGTYFGGDSAEWGYTGAISDSGYIYIAGNTTSSNLIATPGAFLSTYLSDIFWYIARFDSTGQRSWGTYFGDTVQIANSDPKLATVGKGIVYMASSTVLPTYCATPGAYQTFYRGGVWGGDAFLEKFYDCTFPDPAGLITGPVSLCKNTTGLTYSVLPVNHATGYSWSVPSGIDILSGINTHSITVKVKNNAVSGNISVYPYNSCGSIDTATLAVTVHDDPIINITGNDTLCQGVSSLFGTSPGKTNYQWSYSLGGTVISGGTNSSNTVTMVWSIPGANWIAVNYTDANGCTDTIPVQKNVWIKTGPPLSVSITASDNSVCAGTLITFTAFPVNGGNLLTYQWKVNGLIAGSNSASFAYTPSNGDIVYCILTSNNGCSSNNPATSNSILMVINPILPVSVTISPSANPVCAGVSVTFTATPIHGGATPFYQWKVNGINVGSNSSSYSYTPANGDLVKCVLTSSEICTSNNPATSNQVTMVVSPHLVAGITISASVNPVCSGLPVTFTAVPTNGGTPPQYQWKVNGINGGANNPVYTYSPTSGDQVSCILTSNLNCITNNPATSNTITVITNTSPVVTFTLCFDSITTINAKPIKLKGGIPLGGTYSGPGVNSITGLLTPLTAGIGTKTITYSYTNSALCTANKSKTIIVQATTAFTCGNNLTDVRDGKVYPTVKIASQCWIASNLNYGTMIASTSHQRDNCINEKYCYQDLSANCNVQGANYQWDEIMRYDDTPAQQGLCPPAWHVPTEAEWNALFTNWTNNGFAGSPLKYSGYSGFNALLSGVNHFNRQWDFNGFATFFWSSSPYGPYKAWAHGLNDYNPSVSFYPSSRANAFSIRCLKD